MPGSTHFLFVTRSGVGTGGMQTWARAFLRFLERSGADYEVCAFRGTRFLLPIFFFRVILRCVFFQGSFVHFSDGVFAPFVLLLRMLRPGLTYTITLHGLDVVYDRRWYQWLLTYSLPHFQTIVCVSEATKKEALKRGASLDRTIVIPPGIETSTVLIQKQKAPHPRFLILGRQIPRKGTVWFLTSVLSKLHSTMPDAMIVIAGTGPELPKIRRIVRELGFEKSVHVLGVVSDAKREELFQTSTHFLMPNISIQGDMEGFGIACIEAALRGLIVIAASLEGICDAVSETTGFLFVPGDADSCLKAILLSMSQPLDTAVVSKIIREKFSIDRTGSLYRTHVFCAS